MCGNEIAKIETRKSESDAGTENDRDDDVTVVVVFVACYLF